MQRIMVVPRQKLFKKHYFEGFSDFDYYDTILEEFHYMDRDKAEYDPNFKQPIAYCVVVKDGKVYVYQRTKKGNEERLHSKWTIGLGGHIDECDLESDDVVMESLRRELDEEVDIGEYETEIVGYINLEYGVHQVHFGILFVAFTESEVKAKNREISNARFVTTEQLKEIFKQDVEGWSEVALNPVLRFLEKA